MCTESYNKERLAYSRQEAAEALRCSVASVDRLVKRGLLHPSYALRRVIFARAELERFLRESSELVML